MSRPLSDNTFIFSQPIDTDYVVELYGGDYVMIEETFVDVLKDYDSFVQKIYSSYETGDLSALKGAVHKIKPLFGFVGLTSIQSQCHLFENACQLSTIPDLANEYISLKNTLIQAKNIILAEKERLSRYNEL